MNVYTSSDMTKVNRKIDALVFAVEMLLGFFIILTGKVIDSFPMIAIGTIYILFFTVFALIKTIFGGKHG